MKKIIKLLIVLITILNLVAEEIPDTAVEAFESAKLNQVFAKEKYLKLINGVWPEQSESLSFFAENAPDALAIAMPKLREQAKARARRELLKSANNSQIIVKSLLNMLQSYSLSSSDVSYFSWESAAGIEFVREALAKNVESKTGILLMQTNINEPKQLDAYIQKVRDSLGVKENIPDIKTNAEIVEMSAQYLLSSEIHDKVISLKNLENCKDQKASEQLIMFLKSQISKTKNVFPDIDDVFIWVRTIHALEQINGSRFPSRNPVTTNEWLTFADSISESGKWISKKKE